MRISELSPSLLGAAAAAAASHDSHSHLDNLESLIKEAETLTPSTISSLESLSGGLQRAITRLSSLHPLSDSAKLHIWKLSYRLWNSCVDISNAVRSCSDGAVYGVFSEHHAKLRQAAADLLFLAGNPKGIPSPEFKSASFFYKTGLLWFDLKRFDLAAGCFERATDLVSSVPVERVLDGEERKLLLDVNLARARTAWEVEDRSVAIALLNRSRSVLFGSAGGYVTLAEQYFQFGKLELAKNSDASAAASPSKLLNEALDLCEKGMRVSGTPNDKLALESLKGRCLRFLAAERLQAEDYEGVLRCVRVLREGGGKEGDHPSVAFVALRAWLGMGRTTEAEKELKGMVVNKGVPEAVCVSAAEVFLAAAGAEAAKEVLMGLMGRCRVGAPAALRVVQRVVAGGGGGRVRVVAELVSDDRVVDLFAGGQAAKERGAMHAILWNYGAEHFRSKDYEIAAEMFEKSMLYIAHDEENRPRRANCYRVLCLCHLGLSHLDRAQEFINEAEKLQPNINCAFLKFKIYLQKESEKEAINQIEAIVNCIDFIPEYLTLATHEAMACRSIPVSVASLSILLNLYSPGKTMPMPEVAVLRNSIALLQRSTGSELEILKYTKRARTRMAEIGAESFFGNGAVGSRELNWFAANSWNMGLKAGREKNYEWCVEFLESASEFYSAVNENTAENTAMLCKVLILTVSAMIVEGHSKAALPDADIKKAMQMIDRAGKILSSPPISTSHFTDNPPLIEPGLFFLHTFNTYQILGSLSEDPFSKQLQLMKSFVSSKCCTAQNLLQLGLAASQGPRPNPEAANFTLNTCLSELLSSPSPDYRTVSLVLRKLVGLAALQKEMEGNNGDGAYEVYRQAYRIVIGLKNGEYPKEEGKWLAMTAWNRSGMAVRLGQVEIARKWMKMGLDLAQHLSGMESYIESMEECLRSFEKISGGGSSMIAEC